jgi:hypothetical protein
MNHPTFNELSQMAFFEPLNFNLLNDWYNYQRNNLQLYPISVGSYSKLLFSII